MKDICCIGHITLDKIVTAEDTFFQNGGTAYYFAYGMNRLPKNVSYQLVTSIAEKDFSVIERMQEDGIDVLAYPSKDTVFFENKYGINKNERTQQVLGKSDPFTVSQMEDIDARYYHLGTLLSDDFTPELVKYLAGKGKVSMDVQGYLRAVRGTQVVPVDWIDKEDVLAYTDILKLNEDEMVVITGEKDPRSVARKIASWGVNEVVITFGSEGSLIYAGGRFYEIPAYPIRQSVDVTGCGDTYSTGYLYCRAQGMNYVESGKFAAAMCSIKIEQPGPFCGTIEDILEKMK